MISTVIIHKSLSLFNDCFDDCRQLWLFAPGTKMSVMFNRASSADTEEIYNSASNPNYTSTPTLVFNNNGYTHSSTNGKGKFSDEADA